MNMFLVHSKNGIYINRCVPQVDNDGSNPKPLCEDDIVNNLTVECVWSLDRFVRLCSCSLSGDVAIVDDRVGLSLLHLKSGVHSNLSVDTLRGVGKFKNIYTPLGCKNIKHLQWSQNGIYLVVYFNLSSYSDGGTDNLHIWNIARKNIIGTFNIRRLLPEQWPVIKWIGLSDNFILCSNNQISIYSLPTTDVSAIKSIRSLYTIQINRVFSVEAFLQSVHHSRDTIFINGDGSNSLTSSYSDFTVNNIIHMAGFIPADVSLHLNGCLRMSTITCSDTLATETNIRLHELKYADSAELLWSPSGKYLMVLAQSMVDMAGEKYGSTMNCLIYTSDGEFYKKANDSIVHDARWNSCIDEFIIMQGNMPCSISLYNINCEVLYEFPKSYRNTIRWNSLGNMVAFGGFGNLAGEVCFWYNKGDNEMEQIVQFKEPCTVLSNWSLDSKYFMTASTFPRMKVDNFLKIFNCEGYLIINQKLDECYNVFWLSDGNLKTNEEFVRPRVRRSIQKKAIYRPKGVKKDNVETVLLTNKSNFSKAPGSPFHIVTALQDSKNEIQTERLNTLFFNEYGGKLDNSSNSLLDIFQNVFLQNIGVKENVQRGKIDMSNDSKKPINNKNLSMYMKIKN